MSWKMMTIKDHPSYRYAYDVVSGTEEAPDYVVKQCREFLDICDDKKDGYFVDIKRVKRINKILRLIKMPKGLRMGEVIYDCLAGFQWLLIIAALCVMHRDNPKKRKYETVLLEIARKNGKTFIIAVLFILLFFLEPKFSYFYSVAPDGALSREIKKALEEIIKFNQDVFPLEGSERVFKLRRDDIECLIKDSKYIPLNYSNSRLDGKLPNVFLVDEVGALPNNYAIEAMRSGQLTILNKLGFVISTKYPTMNNPFEDEVLYCQKVLDGHMKDETLFALLYEPDNKKDWMSDETILKHANPLSLVVPEIWEDLMKKRNRAIEVESARENFLTKHCNIIYQGMGTETYIPVDKVKECRVPEIVWSGRRVWIGVDLSMSNDNCSVVMSSVDDDENIITKPMVFIPEGRVLEKTRAEHVDYQKFIEKKQCIACGDMVVDYSVIEDYVFGLEENLGVEIVAIGYDRWNALSSAQKWDRKYTTVEIRQHSDTLHPPTKLLYEKIIDKGFQYEENQLFEINFENARCTFDTNMNRYVTKKRSIGKVDMVVAQINAMYLIQQDVIFGSDNFIVQVV